MSYPRAPLVETFKIFVHAYAQYGGKVERFRGLNQSNLWQTMASVAADNSEEWMDYDLSGADGGIEKMPELFHWDDVLRAGGKLVVGSEARGLYSPTHRSPTLAESLLFYSITRAETLCSNPDLRAPKQLVGLTEENIFTPQGKPAAIVLSATKGDELRPARKSAYFLKRENDWMGFHAFLAVPL